MTALSVARDRALELAAALCLAALTSLITVWTLDRIPFAHPSWLPDTFAGTLIALGLIVAAVVLYRWEVGPRTLWALGVCGPGMLVGLHLGALLHGTSHYLFGLGGDQSNRVPYLGRFADSPALADVFYANTAPFYPAQWFWVGGRLADLVGQPAWQFYKPYSIATMAIAGALAFVVWRWWLAPRLALLLGLATTIVGVHTAAYEPYSWILIALLPQVAVATVRLAAGLTSTDFAHHPGYPQDTTSPWLTTAALGGYLGWAALSYTLIAGFAAAVVAAILLGHAWAHRHRLTVVLAVVQHLLVTAGISMVLALVFWYRYLAALLSGAPHEKSVANDFAPQLAASWPLPIFDSSALGVLSMIGCIWLLASVWPVARKRALTPVRQELEQRLHTGDHSPHVAAATPQSPPRLVWTVGPDIARAFAIVLAAALAWYILSGLRSVTGHTLLPFRMIPVVELVLVLAGVCGAVALAQWAVRTSSSSTRERTRAIAAVLATAAAIHAGQSISEEDAHFAAVAHDTAPPPVAVLSAIADLTGGTEPADLVVLTDNASVLAYRPYFSFQAPAQAYATPTGRYAARLDEIRSWARAPSGRELVTQMESGPFRPPDVLVLRRADSMDEPPNGASPYDLVFTALVNTMPRQDNNIFEPLIFSPRLFDDSSRFTVREAGDYVVIARR